jgi:predicted O-methyltransferase YrrM
MTAIVARAVRHPRWLLVGARQLRLRRSASPGLQVELYREYLTRPERAVAHALRVPVDDARRAMEASWWPENAEWAAGDDLTRTLRAVVRLLRPTVVVEAGVAAGVSTAVILHGLEENGQGRLHSVDLPLLGKEDAVGALVPSPLRHRWSLSLGPANVVLPTLLERVSPVGLFLHDADHSYRSQLNEYDLAWPHLEPGGVLVSDDVNNPAFIDFTRKIGVRPWLIYRQGKAAAVGLAVKPKR